MSLVPRKGIELVKGNTGLKDIHKTESGMVYGLDYQIPYLFRVPGKRPGHKACMQSNGYRKSDCYGPKQ